MADSVIYRRGLTPLSLQFSPAPFNSTPPQALPADTTKSSAAEARAATMLKLGQTLEDLPATVAKQIQAGRQLREQGAGIDLKNRALSGDLTPSEQAALSNFVIDESGARTYKGVDPILRDVELDTAKARARYYNAQAERKTAPDLYQEQDSEFAPEGTSVEPPLPVSDDPLFPNTDLPVSDVTVEGERWHNDIIPPPTDQPGMLVEFDPTQPETPVVQTPTAKTGIPTGDNIVVSKANPNKWKDTSTGIISMRRDDGVILDLIPGSKSFRPRAGSNEDPDAKMDEKLKGEGYDTAGMTREQKFAKLREISGGKRLTEGEQKTAIYARRAGASNTNLDNILKSFDPSTIGGGIDVMATQTPLTNFFASPNAQAFDAAGREFIAAILRKDTGAALTKQEREEYGRIYLPRPGDNAEVLKQKAEARKRAIEDLQSTLPDRATETQTKTDAKGVWMQAPDGTKAFVKPDSIEKYRAKGAVLIK